MDKQCIVVEAFSYISFTSSFMMVTILFFVNPPNGRRKCIYKLSGNSVKTLYNVDHVLE